MLAASLNAFFCASPIYGSADDFTFLLNFTPCKSVTPAAKQQVGETRKKRLAQRLAFFRFDYSSGIIKGEQPLIRASRASKVAGAFLVLFWHAKENLAPPQERFNPRHQRVKPFIKPHTAKSSPAGSFLLYHLLRERFLRRRFSEPPPATIVRKPSTMRMPTSTAMSRSVVLASVRKSDTYSLWVTRSTVPIS